MQKKILSILLIIALIIPLIPSIVLASDATTKDYSEITKLSSDYSYGTLFWTDETEIIELDDNQSTADESNGTNDKYYFRATPGKIISVKITNCAVDKDGDMCDAICKIVDIVRFKEENIQTDTEGNDLSRAKLTIEKYGTSNLIDFWFETVSAEGHFTLQYVKAGTDETANITKTTASIGDIDVVHNDKNGDLWLGCEGFTIDGADGDVYYKKGNWLIDTEDDKGVRTPVREQGHTINKYITGTTDLNPNIDPQDQDKELVEHDNDIDLYNSAVVTEDISNDKTFKLFYSGYQCGIIYVFASPYSFELDKPIKRANKSVVRAGDEFNYTIKQYVPNNYYADQLNFVSNGGKYSSFVLSDTLDSNVELNGEISAITVKNESNKTVSYFDIAKDGNTITATAKAEALSDIDFYAHTYKITIPVKVKNISDTSVTRISNKATTVARIGTNEPETQESNTVNVPLQYIVEFRSQGGTSVDSQYVNANETATEPTDPTREGYTFVEWTIDEEGTTPYNFETPVTEDKVLYAQWTPVEYNILYVLNDNNDATNPETNPTKYHTGDTITSFAEPTRPGYDFVGWYADENLTTEFPGISATDSGDKTLYAKWTPKDDTGYIVEHYLETVDGTYEKDINSTQNLTGETGETVTAVAKTFTGFTENTTHEDRVNTGTVAGDGSLVLKLYYDRIEYKVTFDTKGGTPKPEDQTKKYGEKATEPTDPTLTGYKFNGWYYLDDDGKKIDYDFDTPVTHDIDLIAKWDANQKDEDTPITPKDDNTTIVPTKEDTTTAKTILPNTGKTTAIAIVLGVCVIAIVGKKYYNLRDINK